MRTGSLLLTGCLIAVLALLPAAAEPGPKGGSAEPPGLNVVVRHRGDPFCPTRTLMSGNVVIPVGCYLLSVLRDKGATFLAFAPLQTGISPGRLVRLDTPAGLGLKGRLFLIPLSTTAVLVPLDTMTLVAAQIEYLGERIAITLTGLATAVPPLEIQEY